MAATEFEIFLSHRKNFWGKNFLNVFLDVSSNLRQLLKKKSVAAENFNWLYLRTEAFPGTSRLHDVPNFLRPTRKWNKNFGGRIPLSFPEASHFLVIFRFLKKNKFWSKNQKFCSKIQKKF